MSPPVLLFKFSRFFYILKIPILPRVLSYLNRLMFSVWLPASVKTGANLTLGYWGLGIVVHSNCVIGNNCQISQNVTIGRNCGDIKVPIIGNNVYVGTGSVVFGNIDIGDNVIIGANSVINKSIEKNLIVAGNPYKVIGNTDGKSFKELDFERRNKNF